MKVKYVYIIGENKRVEYKFREDGFVRVEFYKPNLDDSLEDEVISTDYFKLPTSTEQVFYVAPDPFLDIKIENDVTMLSVINFVSADDMDENYEEEWIDVEFTEFDIPENIEIKEFEQLVIPEPTQEDEVDLQEVTELKREIESLKDRIETTKKDSETLALSTFELVMSLIG